MTITPDFLAELRARLALSDIIGRSVSFDRRKSNPRKRDYWACCPFHHEKTPSFHVDDDKGRYYCFGCGAKGDAVTFLMEKQSLSFREAVTALAEEAGLKVPAPTPEAARAERARATLFDVLEEATRFFAAALAGPEGQRARHYLENRGIDSAIQARFRLGYAPGGGQGLQKALIRDTITADLLRQAGLTGQKDPDRPPYDYFRDRVIFPIADRQGRIIGFGGRVLNPDVEPKYLNSPETAVFKKGQVLYNHDRAREAARDARHLVLAEGYVDVIAFDRAGQAAAVAPLGTALTEAQLEAAWRLNPEPILCFDGDGAGLRAAHRALSLALPLITPRRTVRFALLPAGLDPDDLLAAQGPHALARVLDKAIGVADLLWQRERDAGPLDTPERRAGLDERIREAVDSVADQALRYHLRSDLFARSRSHFRATRPPEGQARGRMPGARGRASQAGSWGVPAATRELKQSPLVALSRRAEGGAREKGTLAGGASRLLEDTRQLSKAREWALLALALRHPWLLDDGAEDLALLEMDDPDCVRLRAALLAVVEEFGEKTENGDKKALDSQILKGHLSNGGIGSLVARILNSDLVRSNRAMAPDAPIEIVRPVWQQTISLHHRLATCRAELRGTLSAFHQANTPENEARLITICDQIHELSHGVASSGTDSP